MDKSKLAVDTYEKIAGKYAEQYFDDLVDLPYIDNFLAKLPKGGKVLDVGSGAGQFSKHMMDKGFEVIGIDYSQEMVKIAKEKVPSGDFRHMDMRHLDFSDGSFDGVFAAYSLIHIPSEEIPATLLEFKRILKVGGHIEIGVQQGEADQIVDEPFMPTEKMFFNFFSPARLAKFLVDASFTVVSQKLMSINDAETMSDKVFYTIAKRGI